MDAQTLKIQIKDEALKTRALRVAAQVALQQARSTDTPRDQYRLLYNRIIDRRWKRRELHLAYGYLRNRRYEQLEAKCTERLYGIQLVDYVKDQGVTSGHLQQWLEGRSITRQQIEAATVAAATGDGKEQVA